MREVIGGFIAFFVVATAVTTLFALGAFAGLFVLKVFFGLFSITLLDAIAWVSQ